MRNEAKVKANGWEPKYYHLKLGMVKDGRGSDGTITVCLFKVPSTGHYVRGIAFCSPKDQFVKKLGRDIALGRAVRAAEQRVAAEEMAGSKFKIARSYLLGWFGSANLSNYAFLPTLYEAKRLVAPAKA